MLSFNNASYIIGIEFGSFLINLIYYVGVQTINLAFISRSNYFKLRTIIYSEDFTIEIVAVCSFN